jgi:hypothetical protein
MDYLWGKQSQIFAMSPDGAPGGIQSWYLGVELHLSLVAASRDFTRFIGGYRQLPAKICLLRSGRHQQLVS